MVVPWSDIAVRYLPPMRGAFPPSSGAGGDSGRQQQDDSGSGGSAEQTEFAFRLHLYKAKVLLLQEQVRE